MDSPKLQRENEEKLAALEGRIEQLSHGEQERVRKISGMHENEWNRDREPEYEATIADRVRSLEYAFGFADKPGQIMVLDRMSGRDVINAIRGMLVGYSDAVKGLETLQDANEKLSPDSQIKYRVVIADKAPEDEEAGELFVSRVKRVSPTTSTILMLGKDEELVDTRDIDMLVRMPIEGADTDLLDKIILACVRSDVRNQKNEERKKVDDGEYGFVVPQPGLNPFDYEDVLKASIEELEASLAPMFNFSSRVPKTMHTAEPQYPGAATGKLFRSFKNALYHERNRGNIVFYVDDLNTLSLRDVRVLRHATGIIFGNVSRRSHHAIDLMSAGIPMIKCENTAKEGGKYAFGKFKIDEEDVISFNGQTGEIYKGAFKVKPSPVTNRLRATEEEDVQVIDGFKSNMRKCDEVLEGRIRLMVNADSTETISESGEFGVYDVGLVRSENVLKAKLSNVKKYGAYFLALTAGKRKVISRARREFKRAQADAFYEILKRQRGRRTQIRLLDAPLNEFFDDEIIDDVAKSTTGITKDDAAVFKELVSDPVRQKEERGVVIGVEHPEIYEAQIEALFEAYMRLREECSEDEIDLKIFIPYVYNIDQVRFVRDMAMRINDEKYGGNAKYDLGVTLETIGGVMSADKMLEMGIRHFTFGTNDLFPLIEAKERNRDKDDYQVVDGKYIMNPAIPQTLRSCLQNMAATGISRDQYEVGISGEMNPIKLENLKEIVPGLDYVSASRALQIPVLKLKLAQIYVERAKNMAVGRPNNSD